MQPAVSPRRLLWLKLVGFAGMFAGWSVKSAPGVLGVGLLCLGAGMIYRPLGFLVGGVFLLLLDRRMPH